MTLSSRSWPMGPADGTHELPADEACAAAIVIATARKG